MSIGDSIKKYRNAKNLTQSQLAELSFCSESSIRKYEKGIRIPGSEILVKIAAALDIPFSELIEDNTINLTGSDTEQIETYIDVIMGMPELKPLINIFRNKGYELRQEKNGYDIYLIKDGEPVAKIPEKDFADFGAKMIYVINEFTDFEFSKLIDAFTFLY
ncbi:helix-turn-helix transcriptional regulator [Clostridium botulinum]|nr:helix-turn-helix transcriptional regulator [Clostridium botulinum]NFI18093.1 helix-turn-helix transcriptional regulator [Clostridium botulinum]NFL93059.1 helix-turn-helix transcriptional regulator [Clostridium botulinum]NFN51634.1 helix-turn-helix transcriptional regulator [Clostridium botulinum]NFO27258.1 helix-turn-helix transcriptional regulator [Clostridium botulinum]